MIENADVDTIIQDLLEEWYGPFKEHMDQEEDPPGDQGNVQDDGQGDDQ